MKSILTIVTHSNRLPVLEDVSLLLVRIGIGLAMLTHAIPKLVNYSTLSQTFFDPFGLGSQVSLTMALSSELVCSLLLILGLFTRFSAAMLLFTMGIAVYMVGMAKGWAGNELATVYCFVYVLLITFGGGKYSLERRIVPSESEAVSPQSAKLA